MKDQRETASPKSLGWNTDGLEELFSYARKHNLTGPVILHTIAEIAKQHGKRVVLDEAWLYKTDAPTANSVAASSEAFRRDVFSFWAPLDQQFLATIVESALLEGIEYISPFWIPDCQKAKVTVRVITVSSL